MDYPRELPGDPGSRRLDRRDAGDRPAGGPAVRRPGLRHPVSPPRRPDGLQGRRPGRRAEGGPGPVRGDLRRRLRPASPTSSSGRSRTSPTPQVAMVQARWTHLNRDYSLLTKVQSILLDAHFVLEHGGRNRCGPVLQLQRHGRDLAARGDRVRRRLAARHADRGPRPQLPHPARGLAVRLPARRRGARRGAGRDERVQVAAAPVGEGVHPDLPEAAAADPPVEHAAAGQGRGVLPPHGELQLPADGRSSRC